MKVITGLHIGKQICEALGLDPTTINQIVVDIPSFSAVTITVTSYVSSEHGASFANALDELMEASGDEETKRYQLIEVVK